MQWRWAYLAAIVIARLGSAAAQEDAPPLYPVEAYAKLPFAFAPRLSPDGNSIAYITAAVDGCKSVIAHPISSLERGKTTSLPHLTARG